MSTLQAMACDIATHQVELTFVGAVPIKRVQRASGVGHVEVDGSLLRCSVSGSFQPLLEALHGYEVVNLTSMPMPRPDLQAGDQ